MNNATYPLMVDHLGKPDKALNVLQRFLKGATPAAMSVLPESSQSRPTKRTRSLRSD